MDVSGSEEDYFALVYRLWKERKTFIIVEHDLLPHPGQLIELDKCKEELCIVQAPLLMFGADPMMGDGLLKFHSNLMERYPDHLDNIKDHDWHNVSHWLTEKMKERVPYHLHVPPVEHLSATRFTQSWGPFKMDYPGTPTHRGRGPGEPCTECNEK